MPQAAAGLVALGEFIAAYGAYVAVAVSVLSTVYSYASREKPKEMRPGDPGMKLNTCSTQEVLKIVYGVQKVGGNDVFMTLDSSGSGYDILWIVQTLSEGQCDGIYQVSGTDRVWLNDKLESTYGSYATYYFHSGSSNQTVDTHLAAAIPSWTDPMRYTCYIVWKLKYNKDVYQSLPARQVELKGRRLYDFRDATTAWSDNPVLCLYDYVTNTRYGMGIDSTKIDTTSWTSAANYCDTKGWTLNMAVSQADAAIDVVESICNHFRGALIWFDGKYYLRYCDTTVESSVMTITDAHIYQEQSGKAVISVAEPSQFDSPDAIAVKFIDPNKNYVIDEIMVGDNTGVVKSFELLGCTDREMASNLGTYYLERWQMDRVISGRFRSDCLQVEPNDLVTLNTTALSISNQLMRVREANILPDLTIELLLEYDDDVLYDDSYNLNAENVYTCSLPDPSDEPPAVVNAQLTEETYNYRLRTFTRLKVTFDPPANYAWFDHVEVWLSYDDSTWEHLFDSTSDFEISNVEEGQDYYVRLKSVSIFGVRQQDINDRRLHKYISGYVNQPDSLAALYAIVTQNAVNLYADKIDDTDIELYEFRLGSSWSGGIFLASLRAPNLSLAGVKPGTHTFIANTLGNNGEYGETPRTAAATIIDPPDGWSVTDTETCTYFEAGETMTASYASVAVTLQDAGMTEA